MKILAFLVLLVLAACRQDSADSKSAKMNETSAPKESASMVVPAPDADKASGTSAVPEATQAMGPKLSETPADKLGTSPDGLGLKIGDKAPDATLIDVSSTSRALSDLYAQGPTFLVFYRGGWCPFCNLQLHALSEAMPEFERRGVRLIAISVDLPGQEAITQAKQGVPFPMLSDPELVAHKAFKVVHTPDPEELKKFEEYKVDLTAYSGRSHKSFAVPSIFFIDRTGTIRFAHVDDEYKTRPSPPQLLGVADRLMNE